MLKFGFLSIIIVLLATVSLSGQSSYLSYEHGLYDFMFRRALLAGPDSTYHYSVNKIRLDTGEGILNSQDSTDMSSTDAFLRKYYLRDLGYGPAPGSDRTGLWNWLYRNPAHMFEHQSSSFEFTLNPFMQLSGGHESEEGRFIFQNTRGIELWGKLDDRFYFYSSFFENQSNFLNYIEERISNYKTIPGYGHYRTYQSSLITALNGYDYANSRAYLGYRTSKHTLLELGHGNHRIGNGIRSLLLSDFSHNYFYLNFTVQVWKIHYQSMVAELNPIASNETIGNTVLPKKYFAMHYLNLKLSSRLELGLFESVVFSRTNQFELQYLNPVILYRTVEALFDSPDNVLLGFNLNWFAFNNGNLYAQLLLDELRSSEIFAGKGWWGNKWGLQLGVRYADLFGVSNLDLNIEYNKVRPYTYSHNTGLNGFPMRSASNFSHFNQALAHPAGANFNEVIFRLKYQPLPRLAVRLQYFYTSQGRNSSTENFGNDILVNNARRVGDFDIMQGQGLKSTIHNTDLQVSYLLFYDFFVDLNLRFREDTREDHDINTHYWALGLRYNIEQRNIDY